MKYTKPHLTAYAAMKLVQSGNQIKWAAPLEPQTIGFTNPAYEADE